jgi:hypothetical protein
MQCSKRSAGNLKSANHLTAGARCANAFVSNDLQQSDAPVFGLRHASRALSLPAVSTSVTYRAVPALARARAKKSVRFAETAGRGLAGAAVLLNLILHLLAVSEGRKTRAFNGGDVDENILTAIVGLNESKALGAVEPLHGTSRHMRIPCNVCNAFDPTEKAGPICIEIWK